MPPALDIELLADDDTSSLTDELADTEADDDDDELLNTNELTDGSPVNEDEFDREDDAEELFDEPATACDALLEDPADTALDSELDAELPPGPWLMIELCADDSPELALELS